MKHPTDEEIEKEAIRRFPDMNINHEYSWGKREGFIECGKWVRDQQSKRKTLNWEITPRGVTPFYAKAEISFGTYEVAYNDSLWGKDFWTWSYNGHSEKCMDKYEAFKLAQADYERRINELYI